MFLQTLRRWPIRLRRIPAHPHCAPALRALASAAVGFLLSGAAVAALPVPLALARLCSLSFGMESIAVYLGALAGYLALWGSSDAVEPLAAGLLMLSGLGLFRELLPAQRWFRSAAGCALYAIVALIFLLQGPMQPFEITFFFVKLVLLAIFTAAFSGPQRTPTLALALISGCSRLVLPGGLPVGAILASGLVCHMLPTNSYLLAAAACGLTLDFCWQPANSATFVYIAAALAAHAVPLRTRVGRALFYSCICTVCVLTSDTPESGLFLTAFIGSMLSCFMPQRTDAPAEQTSPLSSAGNVLDELARILTRPPAARNAAAEASAAQQQHEARLAEARAIAADQYRILARLLRTVPERTAPPVYCPELGVKTRGKEQSADGDRIVSFRCGEWFYLLLCDGMGTGPEAAREAETASRLLRQMIEGGFDAQDAMQTLNALYILRADGGFSTVDLAQISLVTGEGFLHKWGAVPSYLRSRTGIEKIGTASPPPGLGVGETHQAECVRLSMRRGETLVLISDGVTEQSALRALRSGVAPDALAAGIVSRGSQEEPDDRSAAVLRLHPVSSRHKHTTAAAQILSNLTQARNI